MSQPADKIRLYEAAKVSDFHKTPEKSGSADYSINHAGSKLRDYARWLDENNDLTIGALDVLVNNIVGAGIQVDPQITTRRGETIPRANERLRELWDDWSRRADITGELTIEEAQRLACRTWLRDGETFAEHIDGGVRPNRNRVVPYSVRLLESDWLPFEKIQDRSNTQASIVHGVEKDADGIPTAYHFYTELGDPRYIRYSTNMETRRVPAERVEHLKFARRINQTRGVTVFSGVINRLDDIKDAEDSERIAMRVAAAWTAAIIRNPEMLGTNLKSWETEDGDIDDRFKNRYLEMSPGMVWDNLLPGEDIKAIGLDRPNTNLIEFLADQHRRIAAGIGVSASSLTKNYNGTYSAQRQELVEQKPQYDRLRNQFVSQFLRPIYERFVFWAVESGAFALPRNARPETLARADYRAPGMPWIDPKKEMEADAVAVTNGFKSRHMVVRERGYDPAIVDQQLQADMFAVSQNQPSEEMPDEEPDE